MRWPPGWSRNIRDSMKYADHIWYDETSYHIMGKSGWAWVATSHDTLSYHLAASRSRTTFEEHVMVPGRPATVDMYGCYTAVLGPHITGCRSRGLGRREGRYGTDRLPRADGAPEMPERRTRARYVRQALEISKQYTTKYWPRRRQTCYGAHKQPLREGHALCGGPPQCPHAGMQYVTVQYAVDVHRYVAAARHLDIP